MKINKQSFLLLAEGKRYREVRGDERLPFSRPGTGNTNGQIEVTALLGNKRIIECIVEPEVNDAFVDVAGILIRKHNSLPQANKLAVAAFRIPLLTTFFSRRIKFR
jgi:hypothetical protein